MPNNKKLKLSKIKAVDKAHPYSRKAVQMRRAINREEKLGKQKSASENKKTRIAERVLWFKYALPEDTPAATNELVHEIIQLYIQRNDDEIQQVQSKWRKNQPKPARLDLLLLLKQKDMDEYRDGMEIPLLTDAKNVTALRHWDGDYNALPAIKMTTVCKVAEKSAPASQTSTAPNTIESITGMEVDQ
ncbi:hypothetical protein HDU85_003795 [Gaertneriomyces sp. JEL0708]|nr:hypothetical protein HDU85_003795 [Gaertneriomyces sp. JEL0708]